MLDSIKGQTRAVNLLNKLFSDNFQGRTLIFLGDKGVGKFYTAVECARYLLDKNPFISTDFSFYRNDDFSLKTRFFLELLEKPSQKKCAYEYFFYLLGRISQAVALDEVSSTKKKSVADIREELEEILLNQRLETAIKKPKSELKDSLIDISDEISKKQKIPINFIRETIVFHSHRATGKYKITVIGEFENATKEAQNAALKILEEPPATSLVILTSSRKDFILPTILSRSIIVNFSKLSPLCLEEIFGEKAVGFNTTIDLIEDRVYKYTEQKILKVREFWENIAPKVQFDKKIFDFIEDLTSKEKNELSIKFLEELIEFFRNLMILRQSNIRQISLSNYISKHYENIPAPVIKNTNIAEIKEFVSEISSAIGMIKYGNISAKNILPALLIDLSRWYQKRNR